MHYRWALPPDFPALVEIAAASARDNPAAIARGRGFLTGCFDTARFAAFAADLGIMVADDEGRVAGFLCATTSTFGRAIPILTAMHAAYRDSSFEGRRLDTYRLFNYGPVCIAPEYQGRHLLKGLFGALQKELAERYDVGLLFVDRLNRHSLAVHEQSLGMTRINSFQFDGRDYLILAFRWPVYPF